MSATSKRATRSNSNSNNNNTSANNTITTSTPGSTSSHSHSHSVSTNKRKRTEYADLKVGDRLSETQYYEVVSIDGKKVRVRNERGFEFGVSSDIVEEGMYNASQYTETKKVSRTALVEILESAGDTIFTVNFHKKPDESSVMDVLKKFTIADFNDQSKLKKIASDVTNGESRTLIGYLIRSEPKMGRSQVVDLTKPAGQNGRLVDHRTLNWIIFKNVKYEAK